MDSQVKDRKGLSSMLSGADDVEEEEEEHFDSDEDDDDEDDDDFEEDDDDEVSSERRSEEFLLEDERARLEKIFLQLSRERVFLRVHDVVIKGISKTDASLIESEADVLKRATAMHEIIQAADTLNARLRSLGLFDSVDITLQSGPPGTTNVVIEVVEKKSSVSGDVGIFTKPQARSWSLEGKLKLRNLFGCADDWDGYLALGWDQISEISAKVSLPGWKGIKTPVEAQVSLLQQDWLKLSSYKERSLGFSLGLISSVHHDLTYNLAWRHLTNPSEMSSSSVRRQLGQNLLSSLKYTFSIDRRNSSSRPTHGYAFLYTSHIGGLAPGSLRFLRQEFDVHCCLPLGFYNAAVNVGLSSGLIFPWGTGFLDKPSSLSERFFLGGKSSPVCTLGGPSSLLGFKPRGLGPSEPRRHTGTEKFSEDALETDERDALGGDLAVTAFVDLSFDLPLKLLREAGIHGHAFACSGNLTKLTENEYRNFNIKKYMESFRNTVGCGLVIPMKRFRAEVNYCYVVKHGEHDRWKTGFQFRFSSAP
uniref:POTRA domain-containing protein n=1 Tax=Kalanchoe fedtschenkoi TaxID=63787 RepID=A0A7N0TZW5_KALFE